MPYSLQGVFHFCARSVPWLPAFRPPGAWATELPRIPRASSAWVKRARAASARVTVDHEGPDSWGGETRSQRGFRWRPALQRVQVAVALRKAFDEHCTRPGPSIDAEKFKQIRPYQGCGSQIPLMGGRS